MSDTEANPTENDGYTADIAQLTKLFVQMGADVSQAEVMGRQLRKRASQLAVEREISEVEAMDHLLKVAVMGAQGETEWESNKA